MSLTVLEDIEKLTGNAMGGTELMANGLEDRIDQSLLNNFQIVCSRVRDIDLSKIPILWLHDLPNDPESEKVSDPQWRKQFAKFVCVSDWQMQQYNLFKKLPYGESIVLKNAITPFPEAPKTFDDKIRIIYHTTPHRGLEILYPVFAELAKTYDNIVLDVYSSFNIYGWPQRDEPYKALFAKLEEHPQINYHGFRPNEEVREALQNAHIFAYPSVWPETSCIAMIEAMSAGCLCVHPNYAALPETSGGWTSMYQFNEDANLHAREFYIYLKAAIDRVRDADVQNMLNNQRMCTNMFYSWNNRIPQWERLLHELLEAKKRAG